jgi:ADP-heptose:LPS heptosyltransferase
VGLPGEPHVPGAVDLRGKTSLREVFALLKAASGFVGVTSSFSHATNAFGTPGVVLFGPSAPEVWGHANNVNLSRNLPCAPCIDVLHNAPCPYGAECMHIPVAQVQEALRRQLRLSVPQPALAVAE